ncbi:MAG: DUF4426 domain-containing protein [Caldimonas sp.]
MNSLLRQSPWSAFVLAYRLLWTCTAIVLSPATQAQAQVHTASSGDYTLRASTVAAGNLPEAMRRLHGISTDPRTAVINVTVELKGSTAKSNVAADLKVEARNLYGIKTEVAMREVAANGQLSYLGVYDFLPREVLDFTVVAQPNGARSELRLQFRDRLIEPR